MTPTPAIIIMARKPRSEASPVVVPTTAGSSHATDGPPRVGTSTPPAVRIASMLLSPVLPEKMRELRDALGLEVDVADGGIDEQVAWSDRLAGGSVTKVALFPRVDAPTAEATA